MRERLQGSYLLWNFISVCFFYLLAVEVWKFIWLISQYKFHISFPFKLSFFLFHSHPFHVHRKKSGIWLLFKFLVEWENCDLVWEKYRRLENLSRLLVAIIWDAWMVFSISKVRLCCLCCMRVWCREKFDVLVKWRASFDRNIDLLTTKRVHLMLFHRRR